MLRIKQDFVTAEFCVRKLDELQAYALPIPNLVHLALRNRRLTSLSGIPI